jgi:ATP-dependent Lon protease
MEFYDVHFSYIDLESLEESFVTLPEQASGTLIGEEPLSAGHAYAISPGDNGRLGLYRLELQATSGTGKLVRTGMASASGARDAVNVSFNYFKANSNRVSGNLQPDHQDYLLHLADVQGVGNPVHISLALLVTLFSAALGRAVQPQLVLLGNMTLGGTISPVENLAASLQVALDAGAKRVLLPMSSAVDLATVPPELFSKFQTAFYSDPVDAVFKALGTY